jgi:hypothetical protein
MLTLESAPPARARLRVFALYDDHPAGQAARWLMAGIGRLAAPSHEVSRQAWKFDLAGHPRPMRLVNLQDAGEAEVLIVAGSDVARPDPAFLMWLEELVPWKRNRPARGVLLALLAETEPDPLAPPSLLRAALLRFGQRAELELFWQPLRVYAEDDLSWVGPVWERLRPGGAAGFKPALAPVAGGAAGCA